jgi:phage terminase small subunit
MSKGNRGGRPRKPTHLHVVDGTFRPDRHGDLVAAREKIEAAKGAALLRPPAFLGPVGRAEFRRLAEQLRARGGIEQLDRDGLAALTRAWEELVEASRGIAADLAAARAVVEIGEPAESATDARAAYFDAKRIVAHGARIMPTHDGLWAPSPAARVAAAAEKRLLAAAIEFGMTPVSRSRLVSRATVEVQDAGRFAHELQDDRPEARGN